MKCSEVRRVYNEWDFDRIIPSHGVSINCF